MHLPAPGYGCGGEQGVIPIEYELIFETFKCVCSYLPAVPWNGASWLSKMEFPQNAPTTNGFKIPKSIDFRIFEHSILCACIYAHAFMCMHSCVCILQYEDMQVESKRASLQSSIAWRTSHGLWCRTPHPRTWISHIPCGTWTIHIPYGPWIFHREHRLSRFRMEYESFHLPYGIRMFQIPYGVSIFHRAYGLSKSFAYHFLLCRCENFWNAKDTTSVVFHLNTAMVRTCLIDSACDHQNNQLRTKTTQVLQPLSKPHDCDEYSLFGAWTWLWWVFFVDSPSEYLCARISQCEDM